MILKKYVELNLFLRFLVLFSVPDGEGALTLPTTEVNENAWRRRDFLNAFSNEIAEKYFIDGNCMVVLSRGFDGPSGSGTNLVRFDVRSEAENCAERLQPVIEFTFNNNCSRYMVFTPNLRCFWAAYSWARNVSAVRQTPKFLFLPESPEREIRHDLFSLAVTQLWPDVLAADFSNRSGTLKLQIYTNNFHNVQLETMQRCNCIFLDEWSLEGGFSNNVYLYPDKLADLKGKEIKVSTFSYPPYTVFDPLDGFEGRLMLEYCKINNCTTRTVSDEGKLWGAVYSNLSGNGILGQISTGISDAGFAALPISPWENSVMDFSSAYFSSIVTCLVPKPKQLPYWMVPFMPFDVNMWLSLSAAVVAAAVSLRIVTGIASLHTRFRDGLKGKGQFLSMSDSFIRSLGLVVAQSPSSRMIGDSPNRHLFTSFEVLFLFLVACYCAGLEAYLTVPMYYDPIDTVDQLASSGLKWLVEHEAFLYCLMYDNDPKIVDLVGRAVIAPGDQLLRLGSTGRYALALEILPDGSSPDRDHLSEAVISSSHLMKGRLYDSPVGTAFQKGSPYVPAYNRMLHSFMDSGILFFMISQASRTFLSHRKQAALKESRTIRDVPEPRVVKVQHVQGAFCLFLVGVILSSLMLTAEILWFKIKKDHSKSTRRQTA